MEFFSNFKENSVKRKKNMDVHYRSYTHIIEIYRMELIWVLLSNEYEELMGYNSEILYLTNIM